MPHAAAAAIDRADTIASPRGGVDARDLPVAIPLEAASNLRDLGHWPAAGGRSVRAGVLFRAAAPVGLTAADEATVATLGLRTVIDLRGREERANHPSCVPGARLLHLPIEPNIGAGLRDILATAERTGQDSPAALRALLARSYEAYARDCRHQYRALFDAVIESDGQPLLFHCTAGKDRTGFGAALLLRALGVPEEAVMADYLATNRLWRQESARHLHLPEPMRDALVGAHPWLLRAGFGTIDREWGGFDAYAEAVLGLSPSRRAALAAMALRA